MFFSSRKTMHVNDAKKVITILNARGVEYTQHALDHDLPNVQICIKTDDPYYLERITEETKTIQPIIK